MAHPPENHRPTVLKGIGVSPGIVLGPVFHLNRDRLRYPRRRIEPAEVAPEQARFEDAVARAAANIEDLIQDLPEELREHSGILESQRLMLKDRMLYDRTLRIIEEEGVNAEWALEKALAHVRGLFRQIRDPYIRDRVEDVEYVSRQLLRLLTGQRETDIDEIDEPAIVVAHDLSPADTTRMRPDRILAFLTDVGSRTSHTAIMARSLGIPAVVGLENATGAIAPGEQVIVDGMTGEVIVGPDETMRRHFLERREKCIRQRLDFIHHSHLPAETRDGYRVKIKANIELLDEIPTVIEYGAEGIGLFRTEFLYLASRSLPSEDTLYRAYREVAERLAPYPVTIRTLDIGGDKFVSTVSLGDEINPALGLRATRLCLKEPKLFRTQLRAILRASVHGDVRILFPMISGHMEILAVKEHLEATREELRREGVPFRDDLPVGIMIEVPTAVTMADVLAREVDFFSIGTNDLIQYALAIDRVNEHVAHLYEPLHPGVLRLIRQATEAAHQAGIEVAMCGEMAGEATYVPVLLGMGLDELSMNALAIPRVKRMIRLSDQEACRRLAGDLLAASTAREVRERLADFLDQHYPGDFEAATDLYTALRAEDTAASTA
ncbi:phosphoenolpyruvate--protein phosphotransferase [Dissulfurirhabdus thermomarina]|uniref:Phosphoenolpyruvate-protein phosphotransferase n=1 Tax=Dissulfurirhabdus thermomarina TaxID=1765737 RepID=A0A6N9TSE7_DISTH|nr:phosphoenolpyruvate--protein phosphotransferase [Dissulfurirhabdus thermomarina]NDY42674.1 phosphoenolpyruvate--protein phosphotransferase [Dissulfurirhabdus thermomarina]NMX23728.1 phosphoenolpyruvate--protein phosphotransferase [Dissulfurirhabdus thermomarina]